VKPLIPLIPLIVDALIGVGLAIVVVVLMLFASFDSTFIYRGF
jgi:type III secretory pathway component EscV